MDDLNSNPMPRWLTIAVRIVALLFLALAVLSLLGSGRADDVVDKAALSLSFFLIHLPLLAWLQNRGTVSAPAKTKILWSMIGVVAGLILGYFIWNGLLYITMEVIRSEGGGGDLYVPVRRPRFDMRASWGVLCLGVALAFLIAAKPYFSSKTEG